MAETTATGHAAKGGSPRREMVGWDRASMRIGAEWLWNAFPGAGGVWDLGGVTVVMQGARAGRILEAMLVERAEAEGVGLIPPVRLAPGEVADLVAEHAHRPAPPFIRRLAWMRALRETPAEVLAPVVPVPPASDAHRNAIVSMLERVHAELAGEMIRFGEVPERASAAPGFEEPERWVAAGAVQDRYIEILRGDGWVDAEFARMMAVREGRVRRHPGPIALIGVVDLPTVARAALMLAAPDVRTVVFAPPALAHRFDEWGRPDAWWGRDAESSITHAMVRFADEPSDQAAAAIEAIGEISASPSPADVVIGVPDAEVVPAVRRWLGEVGAWGRPASGMPAAHTRPVRALTAMAAMAADPGWAPFAAFVRHPDVERWIDAGVGGENVGTWLAALDAHAEARVPRTAMDSAEHAEDRSAPAVRAVCAAVRTVCGELIDGSLRPISQWVGPIRALTDRLYPPDADVGDARVARVISESLGAIDRTLMELAEVAGTALDAETDAAGALRMIAEFAGRAAIPEVPRHDAVDLVGWLELAADPATTVIVTGMNEGAVPSSVAHDPMLPDGLRRALGLVDDARRVARDAYLMELIAKQGRETRFIVGRRSAEGDPLVPSRLVLRASPDALPQWISRFTASGRDAHRPAPLTPPIVSGGADGFPLRPIVGRPNPVASMSVTAFKTYLDSPYAFYLRYVVKVTEATDTERELTPRGFGSLVHDALRFFADHAGADDGDPIRVERALMECLDAAAEATVGREPSLTVRVQVELARGRLRALAPAQASRRAEGWRIVRTEWDANAPDGEPGAGPVLMVDGAPMPLRGRIDRIEQHEGTGEYAILDFKTGDGTADPDRAHRMARGDRPWIDLQLPLYAILAEKVIGSSLPQLGYCVLPSDVPRDPFRFAEWDRDDIAGAHDAAREVVRAIRTGEYRPIGRARAHDPVTAALLRTDRDTPAEGDGGAP